MNHLEQIEIIIGLFTVIVSVGSSIVAVLVKDAVTKATTKLIIQQLKDKDKDQDLEISKISAELDRVSSNQQKKITYIENLNKNFDDFKESHIREVSNMNTTLQENTKAIHELTGTLSVLKDYLKK